MLTRLHALKQTFSPTHIERLHAYTLTCFKKLSGPPISDYYMLTRLHALTKLLADRYRTDVYMLTRLHAL